MIRITVSTTLDDEFMIKEENEITPAAAVASTKFAGIGGSWMLNGNVLTPEEMEKPFSELGYSNGTSPILANVKNSKCA